MSDEKRNDIYWRGTQGHNGTQGDDQDDRGYLEGDIKERAGFLGPDGMTLPTSDESTVHAYPNHKLYFRYDDIEFRERFPLRVDGVTAMVTGDPNMSAELRAALEKMIRAAIKMAEEKKDDNEQDR